MPVHNRVSILMRKVIACMICLTVAFVCFAGCSGTDAPNINAAELAKQLAEQGSFDEPLTELDAQSAERAFRIDPEDVAAVGAWVGSGATVDEVSVWEGTDTDAAEDIEEELKARLDTRTTDYADYKPEEVPKLNNAILERVGKYVVMCVTPDVNSVRSIIDGAFK